MKEILKIGDRIQDMSCDYECIGTITEIEKGNSIIWITFITDHGDVKEVAYTNVIRKIE